MNTNRQRVGMGHLGDPWGIFADPATAQSDGAWDDYLNPSAQPRSSSSSSPPWWAILGGPILQTTRDIFAPVGTSTAAYGAQSTRYGTPGLTNDQYALLLRQQQYGNTGGIGNQIENFVRNNSTILLIGAGLLVLIQMPGFTRRGR